MTRLVGAKRILTSLASLRGVNVLYKVMVVLHDEDDYIRMNKVYFETMPVAGQYIIHSDGLAYVVEEVTSFAGYVSSKGATTIWSFTKHQKKQLLISCTELILNATLMILKRDSQNTMRVHKNWISENTK